MLIVKVPGTSTFKPRDNRITADILCLKDIDSHNARAEECWKSSTSNWASVENGVRALESEIGDAFVIVARATRMVWKSIVLLS
jgi:hypothetical protein